ncbi:MAG: SIS domain-containing protein [Sphingomonadaceae bacterium]
MLIDIKQKGTLRAPQSDASILERGRAVIETEAAALALLSAGLDDNFARATELILETRGRVVVSGMGKSGHIGRKLAATLASTGTPAIFVHPAEAAHGDLGMLMAGDTLIVLSNSGATSELKMILRHATMLRCPIIGIAAQCESPLMHAATVGLLLPNAREACPANIAPTTSTVLMLALGDALAIAVMGIRGISREGLKALHPGGVIGNRLLPVNEMMHRGEGLPLVPAAMPMREVVVAITQKSFGIAGVIDGDGKLVGVITDGDLRRHVEMLLMSTAADVMTIGPKTVPEGTYVEDALAIMNANKITALFIMRHDAPEVPAGLVHIHDFSRLGLI